MKGLADWIQCALQQTGGIPSGPAARPCLSFCIAVRTSARVGASDEIVPQAVGVLGSRRSLQGVAAQSLYLCLLPIHLEP